MKYPVFLIWLWLGPIYAMYSLYIFNFIKFIIHDNNYSIAKILGMSLLGAFVTFFFASPIIIPNIFFWPLIVMFIWNKLCCKSPLNLHVIYLVAIAVYFGPVLLVYFCKIDNRLEMAVSLLLGIVTLSPLVVYCVVKPNILRGKACVVKPNVRTKNNLNIDKDNNQI